jgi:beta-lactamase class D
MHRTLFAILVFPLVFLGCSTNNVTVEDSFGRYFDSVGVKGTFGLFDNGHGHFTIFNLPRYRDSFYSPGATFDIFQSLVAIQTGVVKDDTSKVPGITLTNAFRTGGDTGQAAFIYLAGKLGKDTLKKWIDSLQYGNKVMSSFPGPFWQNDSLKINCDEQLGLLKKLYFNQLPGFLARTQEIVSRMMLMESNSVYRLSYKTATITKEDGHGIGWIMGWVEENKHPYFFVVNLESADGTKDLRQTGLVIAKKILQQLGFFEGKK